MSLRKYCFPCVRSDVNQLLLGGWVFDRETIALVPLEVVATSHRRRHRELLGILEKS